MPPTGQFLMALKTRMINLKRLGRLPELKADLKTASEIFREHTHILRQRSSTLQSSLTLTPEDDAEPTWPARGLLMAACQANRPVE